MKEHWVNTEAFSCPVIIGRGLVGSVGRIIKEKNLAMGNRVGIVTSDEIFGFWGKEVTNSFSGTGLDVHVVKIPDGESAKELRVLDGLYSQLVRMNFHRDSLIVAVGGGSVSDVAGFAAASFLRGIDYINVPTTFLAQIDSCIGGKTGINHEGGKNLIGAFWAPRGVIIDPAIIETLPPSKIRSGMGEVVKAAVIADESFFEYLEQNFDRIIELSDPELLDEVIERSLLIKAQFVEADERETMGYRVQLNFGHTLGHAFEAVARFFEKSLAHGEAVALGMMAESRLAVLLGILGESEEERVVSLCRKIADTKIIREMPWEQIEWLIKRDKKSGEDGIRFVLPETIGRVILVDQPDEKLIRQAIDEVAKR